MTKIALKQWQQLVAITLFALSMSLTLGMGSAQAAGFDINTASATEIEKNLDGIGPVKAKSIVKHRGKNGKFKSTDDLLKVDGIGPATVKKNFSALGLKRGSIPLKAGVSTKSKTKVSGKTTAKSKASSTKAKSATKAKAKSKTSAAKTKTKVKTSSKVSANTKAKKDSTSK